MVREYQKNQASGSVRLAVTIGVILLALGAAALYAYAASFEEEAESPEEAGQISIEPSEIDYGDIIQGDGKVSGTVVVSNLGSDALKLHRLSTSCGCTTAEMDMSDMRPGESREMNITFDPLVHPDQFGPILRVVYLQTSNPERPEIEIDVMGNVVADESL